MTDEDKIKAGLIKAELWMTPMEVRVVRSVLAALRAHAEGGHLQSELELHKRLSEPPKK
jgi:hypothetical protein